MRVAGRWVGIVGVIAVVMAAQSGSHLLDLVPSTATSLDRSDMASDFSESGPHSVGVRALDGSPDVADVTMWYPSAVDDDVSGTSYAYGVRLLDAATTTAVATFGGRAVPGAPLGGAPRPLVVLSHGFALTPRTYGWLAEHLASHGMVVVAPDHAETLDPRQLWRATIDRPKEIAALLASLEARSAPGGDLEAVVDMSTTAVVGHSYGGYAALAVGGATLDPEEFTRICTAGRSRDAPIAFLCDALEPHLDEIATALPDSSEDHGIDAVVSIAGDAAMFGEAGLGQLTVPVMVIGGTADVDTPYAWGPGITFEHARSGRKAEVALEGAGHLVFAGPCETKRRFLTVADIGFCSDPGWERDAARAVVRHHITAFLRSELFDDAEATSILGTASLDMDGVVYDSEGYR